MRKILSLLVILLMPVVVVAQDSPAEISSEVEDDKGFITRMLEENLSGAGREVVIDGFRGALSSRATYDQITISDADGVWLTLRDGAIQWNRTALLRRRIDITELSAAEILLPRLPAPNEQAVKAETTEFALPQLPVSVEIEQILAERVELGEPVIGIPAALRVSGTMSLADGDGSTHLSIDRLDGPSGQFDLTADYSNDTKTLNLDLKLEEEADGLLVNLVDLYGKPSVQAEITGQGPPSDFVANIQLATDGQPRVTGTATANAGPGPDGSPGTSFKLDLGGDVASLLAPENRAFFGEQTQVSAQGWRGESGRIDVPVLSVETEALSLFGSFATKDNNAPQSANLLVTLGADAGATELPVTLPFGSADTQVQDGRLQLEYDADKGDAWTLTGRVGQVAQQGVKIGQLQLNGGGQVVQTDQGLSHIDGRIEFAGRDIDIEDPGLAQAVGNQVNGATDFRFVPGDVFEMTNLTARGDAYGLTGEATIEGLSTGITVSGNVAASYDDLSNLSQLAARDMQGRATAQIAGNYILLSKGFDLNARIAGEDIALDQPQLDGLLAGESTITLIARRDEEGIQLSELSVNAQRLTAEASGFLNSNSSNLNAAISMPSLSDADAQLGGSLEANAFMNGPAGARRLTISGETLDLKTGITELDGALQGHTNLTVIAAEKDSGYIIEQLQLSNPQLRAEGQGNLIPGQMDAKATIEVADLAAMGRGWSGGFTADATIRDEDGIRFMDVTGRGRDLSLGQANADGALTGITNLTMRVEQQDQVFTIREMELSNDHVNATAQGVFGPGQTDLQADLSIISLASFGPNWSGSAEAQGRVLDQPDGTRRVDVTGTAQDLSLGQTQVDGALRGETRLALRGTEKDGVFTIDEAQVENANLNGTASGTIGPGATDLAASLRAGDLRFLGPDISGRVDVNGRVVDQDGTRQITANGSANGLALGQPRVDPLLTGQTTLDLAATQNAQGLAIQRLLVRNPQVQLTADGNTVSGINLDLAISNIALIQPGLPGPAQITGTVRQAGGDYIMNLSATAPGGTRAQISGSAASNFSTTDLRISGVSDAALANPLIRTRSIEGPVSFDIRMQGQPGIEAITGSVILTDGRLAEPKLGLTISDLDFAANLQNGLISLDGTGQVMAGGTIRVTGPVDMRSGTMDVAISLDGVTLRDPNLYEMRLWGDLSVSGAQAAGLLVSGQIRLGETELRIPSTGMGGAQAIPEIEHVGDTRPVRATRAKAGIEAFPSLASQDAGMQGPAATPPANPPRLDLVLDAPNQVFIRGRGVDAEMGGRIQLQGTTRNVIPIGTLSLVRGRVDLLGKRFVLTEGLVEMQGSLIPVVRLVAETAQDGITTRIILDGEVRDPEITFESAPEMPQEEVLSQLLFGRGLDSISPLQAAQLANAVAVLAGRGGTGIVSNLRNSVGLDDLDLATDDEGNVEVRAGKYLSDNVYTDVSVGDSGKTEINLNLDVSESLRARGSVASDGESTIGIYYERDY